MKTKRRAWLVGGVLALGACALSSHVTVEPLFLMPGDVMRPTSLQDAVDRGDYRQAVAMAERNSRWDDARPESLALLGRAQFYCGRYDAARKTLGKALESRISLELQGEIEWDLAQVAYQLKDLTQALDYTLRAHQHGINIRRWYIDYLKAIQGVELHSISETRQTVVGFRMGSPDLPRIPTVVNGTVANETVIDSGAVMSILSHTFAERANVRPLNVRGTFYGLLGEPISVSFGVIETLKLGGMTIRNVPVAIMADNKLDFFVNKDDRIRIEFLIGTSLLREFRLRFDYARNQLRLDYLEPQDRVPAPDQNLFLVDQKPLVHVAINRQGWFPFLLDTGSEITFMNDDKFVVKNVTFGLPRYHGATMQGLGGAQKTGVRVKDVSIGVHQWAGIFEDLPLYTDERPGAMGILGQNYLKHFYVDIDFGRMRVDIHRPDTQRW